MLLSDHQNSVKSSPKSRKWHFRDSKFKNFLWSLQGRREGGGAGGQNTRGPECSEGPGNRARDLFSRQDCYSVGRTDIWVKYFCVKGKIFFLGKFSNFGMKN